MRNELYFYDTYIMNIQRNDDEGQEQQQQQQQTRTALQQRGYLSLFQNDINHYLVRRRHITTVNYKQRGPLTLESFQRKLKAALREVGYGANYSVFAEAGFLLRHRYNNVLRFFYAGANTQLFQGSIHVHNLESINNLPARVRKQILDAGESAVNSREESGWILVAITNIKFIFVNYF